MTYGKVYDDFWDEDPKTQNISDDGALLAAFLFSGPHRNAIGCFRLKMGAIADITRFGKWGFDRVSIALKELADVGLILRDQETGWTLLLGLLKRDPIKGPKVAVHAAKLAQGVPLNSIVYGPLVERLSPQLEPEQKVLKKGGFWPLKNPIDRVSIEPRFPEPKPDPVPVPETKTTGPAAQAPNAGQAVLALVPEKRKGADRRAVDDQLLDPPANLAKGSKRAMRIPDDWSLTADLREFCKERLGPAVDPDEVLADFMDYWKAVAGAKGVKLDWGATFRNRVRFLERNGGFSKPGSGGRVSRTVQALDNIERKFG
jgi:hypothetical protein